MTATTNELAVFISHSSKDADLAEAVIELLRAALVIAANEIRCSSVDGYRLPVGINTESKLRQEVNAAKVVVGLITPSSLASSYVMFELGARWGTELFLAPLLAGVKAEELSGPLSLLNALLANNEAQLHQLVGEVGHQLGLSLQTPASFVNRVAQVKLLADAVLPTQGVVKPDPAREIDRDLEYVNDGGYYIRKSEYAEGKSIPYCPTCWAGDKKLVPLNPGSGIGHYNCDIHKSNHQTERYRNSLKQRFKNMNRRGPWQ